MTHPQKAILELSLAVLLVSTVALGRVVFSDELTGRQIMEQVEKRQKLDDETRTLEMRLLDGRGGQKIRQARMWNMENDSGLEKIMLVFLEPGDVKGTGLLTWEQASRADDQWLYLPASRRERRIAGGGKKDRFMGTELAYEDLRAENLDEHQYRLLDEQTLDGAACYRVEAILLDEKERRSSGYGKRILWIRKDIFFTAKVEYFDKRGRPIKTLDNGAPVQVIESAYRSDSFVMKNLSNNRATEVSVLERDFNQGLGEDAFTLRKLKSF